jgi:hypothetical protein
MIGVYGLTSADVSTRWRELAVRLALGSSRLEAVWTVLRPCAAILGAGSALGFLGAVSVGPALTSLLHGVGPADGFTLTIAPVPPRCDGDAGCCAGSDARTTSRSGGNLAERIAAGFGDEPVAEIVPALLDIGSALLQSARYARHESSAHLSLALVRGTQPRSCS